MMIVTAGVLTTPPTAKLRISKYVTNSNATANDRAWLNREVQKYGMYHGKKELKFIVTDHCVESWNQRVQPELTQHTLQELIDSLAVIPNRIQFAPNKRREFCLLDDEILFGYRKSSSGKLAITTFYGRVSLQPVLRYFANSKNRTGIRVNLTLSEEEACRVKLPAVPSEFVFYTFEGQEKQLEVYKDETDNNIIFSRDVHGVCEIELNQPLEKGVQVMLEHLGYRCMGKIVA